MFAHISALAKNGRRTVHAVAGTATTGLLIVGLAACGVAGEVDSESEESSAGSSEVAGFEVSPAPTL